MFAEEITRHAYQVTRRDFDILIKGGCTEDEIGAAVPGAAFFNCAVLLYETFAEHLFLFKFKEGEKLNRRNLQPGVLAKYKELLNISGN